MGKSILGWLVGLLIVGGGGAAFMLNAHDMQDSQAYQLGLNELQQDFLQQAVGLRLLDDPAEYRQEIGVQLTRYFAKVRQLGSKHPERLDVERERKRNETLQAEQKIDDVQFAARQERIDFTLDLHRRMLSGQYQPLHTQADKTFRFDIYDMRPVMVGDTPALRVSYAHWGAFGPVAYRSIEGTIRTVQQRGKPTTVPQIVATDAPPTLQIDPQRWVAEFPPGVEIGYYELPLLPHNAESMVLAFDFGIRTVGGTDIPAHIRFGNIPAQETWKLTKDGDWRGHERLVTDEELRAAGGVPSAERKKKDKR